ncbi:hypothetical protein M8J76_000996 [Diaphorina citri]|nr:hypothetical protein M8J76_000996 [Diaphorina citri]
MLHVFWFQDSGTGTSTEDEETSKPSSRSLSECYFAVPLPFNPHPPRVSSPSSDIQKHLQSMFGVLRPQETLKMAVKLESVHPDRTRYLVVVSCDEQGDESCLLGIDCNQTTTVGLVLRVLADTSITLDGDGGFSVCVCGRQHIFKPVSVQAMWSALQSLHKVSSVARDKNYFLTGSSHEWVSHYEAKIASDRSCLNEWHAMDSLESRRPPSPDSLRDKPSQRDETEKIIRSTLKEIIMSVDLDEVTSKYIRSRLEDIMDSDLGEYKSFIDQEMFNILKQMDAATEIFPHVYLGSEWNASNLEELARNGVCHILNVTREIDNFFPGIFDYCNIRVYDDDKTDLLKHWDNTYKYITSAKNQGSKVLVHCKMGISRSASVVIAYAMKAYNWDLTRAMAHVRQKRNCIKPNANFITQLETYQGILDAMKNREKLQRSKSETNLKCNVAVSTRGTSSGGHSQKLGNSAEARSSSVTKEDPAHLLMFDRTGAATPPPSRSLSPHHDPTGYLSPHHEPTGYLSPNDPTGYFTTRHDPSGFLSPDDPTGYLSPHHDPTGFLSTHDPSGYLSHDPTGYLSPHRGTPGSELALSGSRPKSWSPDALEVSTLFETSAPPTSQSLERLTTPSDRAPSPSSPSSLLPTTPPSIPPAPPLPPAPKMYNVNVRMPCGNGLAYSVSQNKVLHLDCTQSPRTIEGGVKSRVYALEANAHPHDGAPPQPSLLSQQIASTVTSMDKKSPPRPRQSISTNTDNTSSSGAMPNSVISLTSQFEPSTSHPTTSSSTTQPSHLVKPRGLRKYLKFMNKSSSSEGKTEGKKSDKNSSEGKHTSDAGKISSSMGKVPEGKNVSDAGKNAASVGKIPSSEAKMFGGRQPLVPANSESAGREISSRLQGLSPANISSSPLSNSHAVRVNLSRQDSWSSQDSAIGPDCSGAVSRQSSWGSYEAGPRGTCRASSLGSYDTEGRGSEGRNFPCNCEGTKVGHFPPKGDCNCGIEGKNYFPSKGDCSCEGTKGGHFPSKEDSNCGSEGTRVHFPSKGEFHCNCLSSSGSLVPLSSQAESNLTQAVGNQSSFRRKHTSESGALSSCSCPTHDISSSTSPPCSESIATCNESIATCSESLDSCVKTSRSDTNEHQSTTPSGVKPSSTTKGDIKDLKPRSTSEGSDVKPTSNNIGSDAKPTSPPRRRICACFRRNSDTREGGGTQDRYTPAPGGCAKDRTDPNGGSKVPEGCAKDRTADVSGSKVPGGCSKHRTGEISGNKVLEGCTKDQTDPRGSSKVPGGCQKDQTDLRGSSKDPNRCSKVQSAEMSGRKVDKSTSGSPEVNLGADRINTDPGGHKGDPGGSYETDRKIAATHCISSVILRKKFYASGSGVSSQSKDRFESLQSSEGTRQGNSTFYVTSRQGGSNGDLSGRAMCDTNSDNTRNSNIGGNSHEGNSRHSCGNFNEGENSHEGNTHIQSSPSNAPCITRGSTSSPSIQHIASTVSLPSPPPPSRPLSQSLFNYSNSYPTPFSAHAHKLKHHHHLSRSFPSVIGSSSGTLGSLPPRSNCDNAPAHWSTRATNQNARPVHSCDVSTNHSAGGGASRFRVVSIATSSQSLNEGTRSSRVSPKRSLSVEEKRKHPNAKETGMVKNLKDEFEAKTESGLKHRRHHSSSSMTCTCEGNSHSRGNFNEGNSHEGHSRHSCGNFNEGNFVETVPDRRDLNNQAGNKLDVRVDIREVGALKADTCDTVRSQDDNVFETQDERNFTPGSTVPRGFNRVNENPNRVNSRLENPAGNESRTHDLTATHPPHTLPVVRKCVHKQAHAQTKSPATEHKKSVKKIVGKFEQKSDNENRRGNETCIADSVSDSRRGTNESRRGNEPCIADGVQENRRGNVVDSFMKYIDDISVREKGAGAVLPLLVVDAARGREGEGEPRLTTANAPPIYNTM